MLFFVGKLKSASDRVYNRKFVLTLNVKLKLQDAE